MANYKKTSTLTHFETEDTEMMKIIIKTLLFCPGFKIITKREHFMCSLLKENRFLAAIESERFVWCKKLFENFDTYRLYMKLIWLKYAFWTQNDWCFMCFKRSVYCSKRETWTFQSISGKWFYNTRFDFIHFARVRMKLN